MTKMPKKSQPANLEELYGGLSSLAQQQVRQVTASLKAAHNQLSRKVAHARPQTAEAAAKLYLCAQHAQLEAAFEELEVLAGHVRILGERQGKLMRGALMRALDSLEYVGGDEGDAFEHSQVLVQAVEDFAARLVERQLVAQAPTTPPLSSQEAYETQGPTFLAPCRQEVEAAGAQSAYFGLAA